MTRLAGQQYGRWEKASGASPWPACFSHKDVDPVLNVSMSHVFACLRMLLRFLGSAWFVLTNLPDSFRPGQWTQKLNTGAAKQRVACATWQRAEISGRRGMAGRLYTSCNMPATADTQDEVVPANTGQRTMVLVGWRSTCTAWSDDDDDDDDASLRVAVTGGVTQHLPRQGCLSPSALQRGRNTLRRNMLACVAIP